MTELITDAVPDLHRAALEENERLRKVLQNVRMQDIGKDLYLGVISEDGCWSVALPEEGKHIFRQWFAGVTAALASCRSTQE